MLKESPEAAPVANHETSLSEARRAIKKQFRKGRLFGEFDDDPLHPFRQAGQLAESDRTITELNHIESGLSAENRERIALLSRDATQE